jgi:hypothetical protein
MKQYVLKHIPTGLYLNCVKIENTFRNRENKQIISVDVRPPQHHYPFTLYMCVSDRPLIRKTRAGLISSIVDLLYLKCPSDLIKLTDFVIEERIYTLTSNTLQEFTDLDRKNLFLNLLNTDYNLKLMYAEASIKQFRYILTIYNYKFNGKIIEKYLRSCSLRKNVHFLANQSCFAFKHEDHMLLLKLHLDEQVQTFDLQNL